MSTHRSISGIVSLGIAFCGLALAALSGCGDGPSDLQEERDPFRPPERADAKNTKRSAPLLGESFPSWAVGVWRGEARDTSDGEGAWDVTLEVRREPGASTIIYRRGEERCSVHPRVITFNERALTLTESPDDVTIACHGIGQTLVMNTADGAGRIEGIYLDFSTGRKLVHGIIALTRIGTHE